MAREELQLEASRFTTAAACAKEVVKLLEDGDCLVIVLTDETVLDRIACELQRNVSEGLLDMERVKIVRLEEN